MSGSKALLLCAAAALVIIGVLTAMGVPWTIDETLAGPPIGMGGGHYSRIRGDGNDGCARGDADGCLDRG